MAKRIEDLIRQAVNAGEARKPISIDEKPVDIEQMRREVEENARRVSALKGELAPPAEMTEYNPTLQQRLGEATEKGLRAVGAPISRARALSDILTGGRMGSPVSVMDFTPVAIPVYGGQGAIDATKLAGEGKYGEAALTAGLAALDLSAAYPATKAMAKAAAPAIKSGAKALAPKAGELAEQYMMRTGMALPMDVWHGSPHRFPPTAKNPLGEFDPTKIGTGEGAQAYGYGHYFAEAPDVSKRYIPRDFAYEDKLMRMYNQAERRQDYATLEVLEDALIHKTPEELRELHPEHGALIDKIARIPQNGSLYKVDLPDEQIAKMLDWDKPLNEQPKEVQDILMPFLPSDAKKAGSKYIRTNSIVNDLILTADNDYELFKNPSVKRFISKYEKNPDDPVVRKQLNYYFKNYPYDKKEFNNPLDSLEASQIVPTGESFKAAQHELGEGKLEELFRGKGIPGIKYFDQSSRSAGEGTRNFVVFPGGEEMLTIKERMKDGGPVKMQWGGIARAGSRMAKYGKHYEPSKKTEIFIGEKSPVWNAGAAGEAVKMEKAGADPVDIWRRTGTFRSPDGALRQEISDVGSKFRDKQDIADMAASMKQQETDIKAKIADSKLHPDLFPKQLTAAQKELRQQAKDIRARRTMEGGPEQRSYNRAEFALEHPELYKAYPNLSGINVRQGGTSGSARASYIEGINEKDPDLMDVYYLGLKGDPRSSAIHEMQHAIQGIEDWGRGGNPQMAFQHPEAHGILNEIRKQALQPMTYEDYAKKANLESMPVNEAMKQYEHYKKSIPEMAKKLDREFQTQAANLYYNRLAGEAEARAVQKRINMSPSERLEIFPLSSYDVLPEDIIVKRKKKGGQVSLDAMRLAVGGMAGGGIRKAMTRSIEEAMRLHEAAQKTRSKAAQIEAGLYHPIGGGVKLSKPVELMTEKTVSDPSVKPVQRRIITPEQMQGGVAIPLIGDRAAAAKILQEVEGRKLREPVKLQGGPGFMQTHTFEDAPESSAAWASGPGVITRLGGLARKASELAGTEKVYAPYVAMSPTGVDFNTMVADALLGQYDPSALTKKAKKEFLKDIRNYAPDTQKPHIKPGSVLTEADLNDVDALRAKMLTPDAGPLRKAFIERMGIREFQEKGFPDVAATRKAITEPELLHEEIGSTGFNIARIDPEGRIVEEPRIPHATYPVQLRGEYFGSLEEPIPYGEFFSGFTESQRLKGKPEKHDWYTFGRSMPIQQLDQEWLDRIMKAKEKPREWKKGGAVKKAAGGEITSDDLVIEERTL